MAEILGIFALTTLAGYLNSKFKNEKIEIRKEVPVELIPSTNKRTIEVQNKMQEMADILVKDSQNPQFTGVIPPLFNTYGTRGQKIQMEERVNAQKMAEIATFNKLANVIEPSGSRPIEFKDIPAFTTGMGVANFGETTQSVSLLTGKPLDLTHSNMVPFFGGTVKQRTDEYANTPLIERFTGTEPKLDRDFKPRFETHKQNIYGSPAFTTQVDMSRFIASPFRENELPFSQKRVSAPIAGGPEDNIKPGYKTIDELVVNSKETYAGRLIESGKLSGGRGDTRGLTGSLNKNKPETSFSWGESRLFKTPGDRLAPKIAPDTSVSLRDQKSIGMEYFGNAGVDNSKTTSRVSRSEIENAEQSLVTKPSDIKRKFLESSNDEFVRNIGKEPQMDDNLKESFFASDTQRATENTQILGGSRAESGHQQYLFDTLKSTTKETTIFNTTDKGPKSAPFTKQMASLDTAPLKTTNKEMNVDNKYTGQAQKGTGLGYIDAASRTFVRTTNKEMGIFENTGMKATLSGVTSEESRDQFKEANFAKQLDNNSRAGGPQKFQISGSKDLINISVKDRELPNKRSANADFVNKSFPSRDLLGSTNLKRSSDATGRTFEVSIVNQLKDNTFNISIV
jgi:hypothetical protein